MTARKKPWIIISIVLVSLVSSIYWAFLAVEDTPRQRDPQTGKSRATPALPPLHASVNKNNIEALQEILNAPRPLAKLDAMVSRSPDKLGATVAAYLLSLDDKYLGELAVFSDSPKACSLLACFSKTPEEKLRWAERLLKLDPSNKLALVVKAKELLMKDQGDAALHLTSQLTSAGKLDLHELDILSDVRAGWRGLGYDETTATRLAVYSDANYSFGSLIRFTLNKMWETRLKSPLNEESLVDAASAQLKVISSFTAAQRPSIQRQIAIREMERSVLESLPPDIEFGREGYTVADYKRDLVSREQQIALDFRESLTTIATASPEMLSKYYDKCFLEGDTAAQAWLLALTRSRAPDGN